MKHQGAICFMRTKVVNEYITDALFDLLKVKELNKISILELIKKAGVCRSSFYRNYFYLEDVIRIYLDDVFERILSLTSIDEIHNQIKNFFTKFCRRGKNSEFWQREIFSISWTSPYTAFASAK